MNGLMKGHTRLEVGGTAAYSPVAVGVFPSAYEGFVHLYVVRFPADIPVDLTVDEARQIAAALVEAADAIAPTLEVLP